MVLHGHSISASSLPEKVKHPALGRGGGRWGSKTADKGSGKFDKGSTKWLMIEDLAYGRGYIVNCSILGQVEAADTA